MTRRPVVARTAPDSYGGFVARPVAARPHAEHGRPLRHGDLVGGRLPVTSFIRTDRVVALDIAMVLKSLGREAPDAIADAVDRPFRTIGHAAR